MGKKGKKGAKGKKKGGKKKKKEDQMTFREAILAYQISIKEKQAEDLNYELKGQEEKYVRNQERNERLQEEQQYYVEELLLKAKEFERSMGDEKEVTKEHVTETLKQNWEEQRLQEIQLEKIREEIRAKEAEVHGAEMEVRFWEQYRDRGSMEHQKQLQILQQEFDDIQTTFDEMAGHIEKTTRHDMDKITRTTEASLAKQKDTASDRAISLMDKHSRQEVLDNDWLKAEAGVHRHEMLEAAKDVERLERENLKIMSELFQCKVEDLRISRNFYLTQFEEGESLPTDGVLEMDLAAVPYRSRPPTRLESEDASSAGGSARSRPRSAIQALVEDKVFSLARGAAALDDGEEDEEDGEVPPGAEGEEEDDLLERYFTFEDETDFLKLGHLELKLLNITGKKAPLHKPMTPSPEEVASKDNVPDEWPVKKHMIRQVL